MKELITPRILSDIPIETAGDTQLQFEAYANTLARMLLSKSTPTPLVIGIYGRWGTGKTTLLQILRAKLNENSGLPQPNTPSFLNHGEEVGSYRTCKTVWFNAWKYSREEELWVALVEQIRMAMWQEEGFIERVVGKIRDLKDKYRWPEALASAATQLITHGRVSLEIGQYREASRFHQNLAFYDEFYVLFDELVADFSRRQEGGLLVVLIDDLDRCLPSKVIQALEAIKLLMDVRGCVFVLGADSTMITAAVQAHYAANGIQVINPKEYLSKIVQIQFDLPPLRVEDAADFVERLPGIETPSARLLRLLVSSIPTNLRRIKTFMNHVQLLWATLVNTGLGSKATKETLIEWLVLYEACPAFCEELTAIEGDQAKIALIVSVKRLAQAGSKERRAMVEADGRLSKFAQDEMLLSLFRQGTFDFSPETIGLYIHLSPAPPLWVASKEPSDIVDDVLATLSPRERRVIEFRFGLGYPQPSTLQFIAGEWGVTSRTVSRWIAVALRKLRHPSRARLLARLAHSDELLDEGCRSLLAAVGIA